MKKIGEYTARGIINEVDTLAGNPQKIPLFDGSFETGYRIKEFYLWGCDFGGLDNANVVGKLSKNDAGPIAGDNFLRADNDNEIAWAGAGGSVAAFTQSVSIIDPDNMVIEDLYVYAQTDATQADPINYMVVMEKYEISDWEGALAMARDRAQE